MKRIIHVEEHLAIALLALLLCSCAGSGAGTNAAGASPTRASITLSVPTVAVSAQPSPAKATTPLNVPAVSTPAPFQVTGVDISASPATLSTWTCGAYIQVVYTATFRVVSGPSGGIISFSYN